MVTMPWWLNLRASVGGKHNIRGQQCIHFEFIIVVNLMWVHLTVMGSMLPWAPVSSLALGLVTVVYLFLRFQSGKNVISAREIGLSV